MAHRDERGVTLVEFALLTPLIFMLIYGMFTGGIAYNRDITLTSATREAARYADTHGVPTSTSVCDGSTVTLTAGTVSPAGCWLGDVLEVAESNAQGQLDASADRDLCVIYVAPSGSGLAHQAYELDWTTADSGRVTSGTTSSTSCAGATTPAQTSDNQVEVVGKRNGSINAVIFNMTITLRSSGFGRVEPT